MTSEHPPVAIVTPDAAEALLASPTGRSTRVTRLEGRIRDRSELFDALEVALDLPRWWGRNWDALNEVLADRFSEEDDGPQRTLVIPGTELRQVAPTVADTLFEVLHAACGADSAWSVLVVEGNVPGPTADTDLA